MPDLSLTFRGYDDAGTGPAGVTSTKTSGQIVRISEAVPANQTNYAVSLAFTVAKLVAVYVAWANDDGTAATALVETNSGSAAQESFTLRGGGPPVQWNADFPTAVPFAGNVTGLYVTNTTAGRLSVLALVDPT